jgi:hypothetical protein
MILTLRRCVDSGQAFPTRSHERDIDPVAEVEIRICRTVQAKGAGSTAGSAQTLALETRYTAEKARMRAMQTALTASVTGYEAELGR